MKYLFITSLIISTFLMLGISQKSFAMTGPSISNFAANICTSSKSCSDAQQGANELDNGSGLTVHQIIKTVVSIFSWIIGIASVFMVIFGGFKFVTAGGNSEAISSARNTVLYALIGITVAVLSQVLARFAIR